jgi:hypothetical protein
MHCLQFCGVATFSSDGEELLSNETSVYTSPFNATSIRGVFRFMLPVPLCKTGKKSNFMICHNTMLAFLACRIQDQTQKAVLLAFALEESMRT